jgi:hypothetical protein
MDESYRLVFRAEMLDGQHRAVVRRRLIELLKIDEATADKLFSGQPVIIKRSVDAAGAARYQNLFRRAGARLRVVAEHPGPGSEAPDAPVSRTEAETPAAGSATTTADEPAPVSTGLSVNADYEPPAQTPRPEIQAPDFGVAAVGADLVDAVRPEPVEIPEADFDLAAPGADLVERVDTPRIETPDPDFQLAEVGADLVLDRPEPRTVDLGPLDFDVAEAGADIGVRSSQEPSEPPDVSHLKLLEP